MRLYAIKWYTWELGSGPVRGGGAMRCVVESGVKFSMLGRASPRRGRLLEMPAFHRKRQSSDIDANSREGIQLTRVVGRGTRLLLVSLGVEG